ncbi:MAG: hypothetical protein IPG50_04510 [Myxococcales bacterium]|nr:hypothetical protein [Myxococcales bacterium]
MRLTALSLVAFVALSVAACGGVAIDPFATNDTASCGANACGACDVGQVNRDECRDGKWSCSCVPRGGGTCTMAPACTPGDRVIASASACPAGATCYANSACGTTVHCAAAGPDTCAAYPSCKPGDVQVTGPITCPSVTPNCNYTQSMCGATIWCHVQSSPPVWPSNASKLVAVNEGGGFVPTPPPGSKCKLGETRFTFNRATRVLDWQICDSNVTPYAMKSGLRTLSTVEAADVDATLSGVSIYTGTSCGADKPLMWMEVSSPGQGTKKFYDSFYSCNGLGTYVDNIDDVFAKLQEFVK